MKNIDELLYEIANNKNMIIMATANFEEYNQIELECAISILLSFLNKYKSISKTININKNNNDSYEFYLLIEEKENKKYNVCLKTLNKEILHIVEVSLNESIYKYKIPIINNKHIKYFIKKDFILIDMDENEVIPTSL